MNRTSAENYGEADIEAVLNDIMRLTKLNYNNCTVANSLPIILKFASKVGDILTTSPSEAGQDEVSDQKPLPFGHGI